MGRHESAMYQSRRTSIGEELGSSSGNHSVASIAAGKDQATMLDAPLNHREGIKTITQLEQAPVQDIGVKQLEPPRAKISKPLGLQHKHRHHLGD